MTGLSLAATAWLDQLLRQADTPELAWLHLTSIPQVVAAVSAAATEGRDARQLKHRPQQTPNPEPTTNPTDPQ